MFRHFADFYLHLGLSAWGSQTKGYIDQVHRMALRASMRFDFAFQTIETGSIGL